MENQPGFGDKVRIKASPETQLLGLAGLKGHVYGFTTLSVTSVAVIGELKEDYAVNISLDEKDKAYWYMSFINMTPNRPVIIVLNGTSSAGKTLTAHALVKILGPACVVTGLDDILERVQPFGPEGSGLWAGLRRGIRIAQFQMTNGRLQLFKTLHREVVIHYQSGRDVIIETSLMDKDALYDASACFSPLNAFFIAMKPPLGVSEEWEAKREDRPPGQARKHYDLIHSHNTYDLVLDPSQMTPDECATTILHRLEGPPPDAFSKLVGDFHE